jgi:hypothetical protein
MTDTTAIAFDLLEWQKRLGWEYDIVETSTSCTVTMEKDGDKVVGAGEYLYDAAQDAIKQIKSLEI